MIYPSRSIEQKRAENYQDLLELDRITRLYLDELPERETKAAGLFKLLIEPEETAGERMAKLSTVPLLRRLGLSDEKISKELNLSLADVQNV